MLKSIKQPLQQPKRKLPTLASVRDALAIVALFVGGLWAATQFAFEKFIEPRLNPAAVKVEAILSKTHESDCCVYLNLDITLRNDGKRDAHLESAFLAVGAKPFSHRANLSPAADGAIAIRLMDGYHSILDPCLTVSTTALYGDLAPTDTDYRVLLASNIVQPRTVLGPNEVTHRRFAFATEKLNPFLSVRANTIAAHQRIEDPRLLWHWRIKSNGMRIFPLPWRRDDGDNLLAFEKCFRNKTRWSQVCARHIDNTANENWKELNRIDRHIFSLPYVMDSFITLEKGG